MLKTFFEWLNFHEEGEKIVEVKGINSFLVDTRGGSRKTVEPLWDRARFKYLAMRVFKTMFPRGKEQK